MKKTFHIVCLVCLCTACAVAEQSTPQLKTQRNTFVYAQLMYNGNWNPYPGVWTEIRTFLDRTVNMQTQEQVRVLSLNDPLLFSSPFLCIVGDKALPSFSTAQKKHLKHYLLNGGMLFINDTSLVRDSKFDQSVRALFQEIFPELQMAMVPYDHAVYKSFYLVRIVGGRSIVVPHLEGIFIEGRLAVVYTRNDILGAYAKDALGNDLYACIPGGYEQRKEAWKLTVNIIVYAVTGTYKEDVVHAPYIQKKTEELFK